MVVSLQKGEECNMARYRDAVCRLCRRDSEKLFLKGDRCYTDKCAIERRKYPPGLHGQKRRKLSDYAIQLREKQKVKRTYGLLERQFRKYYRDAEKKRGVTGERLLQFLELRLDNMVYRMGFAESRNQSRQLVSHGHFLVNGEKVNIPSYRLRVGDSIEIAEKSKGINCIQESLTKIEHRGLSRWVEVDTASGKGKLLSLPSREEIPVVAKEQLIVELYSR